MTKQAPYLGALLLAYAGDWAHKDGTCPIRVHAAVTPPDEDGYLWVVRGTTTYHSPSTSIRLTPDKINNLIRPTWFVADDPTAKVQIHVTDSRRVTGCLTRGQYKRLWDLLEAHLPPA